MKSEAPSLVVAFVLDESGSMAGQQEQTAAGVDQYVNDLKSKHKEEKILFSLTKFNGESTVVHAAEKLVDIPSIKDNYHPNGSTALFDAVGETIKETAKRVDADTPVLVIIMTDGEENASTKYNQHSIKELIEEKKTKNWSFVFLGVGEDKWVKDYAKSMSIMSSVSYDSCDMKHAMRGVSIGTQCYSKGLCAGASAADAAQNFADGFRNIDMDADIDNTKVPVDSKIVKS